jgi:hypothetical protein
VIASALQGLRRHLTMPQSLSTPLCHIPTGSGNGIAATCGLWTPTTAVHAIVKGHVQQMDAASVILPSETVPRLSVLGLQYGLLTDLDIGTEHLRKVILLTPADLCNARQAQHYMLPDFAVGLPAAHPEAACDQAVYKLQVLGGERFTYGAVREILRWRKHKARIAYHNATAAEVNLRLQKPGCALSHSNRMSEVAGVEVANCLQQMWIIAADTCVLGHAQH